VPPPSNCGARVEPWRARPVPFWRYGLAPPPLTWPRVLVACVPWRAAASCALTTWCSRATLASASNSSPGSVALPEVLPAGVRTSTVRSAPAARSGDRALDQDQAALRIHLVDLQRQGRRALAAHAAGHAQALEHAAGG